MRAQFPKDFERRIERQHRRSVRWFGFFGVFAMILYVAFWSAVAFVAIHFIQKWW